MNTDLIKKLKDKGVPADVILELVLDDQEPEQPATPAADPTPQPAADPTPQPAADPAPQPAAPAATDQILAAIERLTGAIQAGNIRGMNSGGPQTETADEILASMIAPKKKGDT